MGVEHVFGLMGKPWENGGLMGFNGIFHGITLW